MHYRQGEHAVEKLDLAVGDQLRLAPEIRLWWRVQAVSENFAVCVQQAPFEPKGTLRYTVIDWRNGIRGACNLIGQGFGDGSYSEEECAEMLTGFEYDYKKDPDYIKAQADFDAGKIERVSWPAKLHLQVSHRNWVRLRIEEHKKSA